MVVVCIKMENDGRKLRETHICDVMFVMPRNIHMGKSGRHLDYNAEAVETNSRATSL